MHPRIVAMVTQWNDCMLPNPLQDHVNHRIETQKPRMVGDTVLVIKPCLPNSYGLFGTIQHMQPTPETARGGCRKLISVERDWLNQVITCIKICVRVPWKILLFALIWPTVGYWLLPVVYRSSSPFFHLTIDDTTQQIIQLSGETIRWSNWVWIGRVFHLL